MCDCEVRKIILCIECLPSKTFFEKHYSKIQIRSFLKAGKAAALSHQLIKQNLGHVSKMCTAQMT